MPTRKHSINLSRMTARLHQQDHRDINHTLIRALEAQVAKAGLCADLKERSRQLLLDLKDQSC